MNIVLLSSHYPPVTKGGAEISTHLLAKELVRIGHKVTVITSGENKQETEFETVNVITTQARLKAKPLFEKRHSRKCARIIGAEIDKLSPDIIHANDFRSTLASVEWKKRNKKNIPLIATARDYAQISGSTNFLNAQGELPADSIKDAYTSHRLEETGKLRSFFRWWQYRFNINYRKKSFQKLDGQVFISQAQANIIKQHQNLDQNKYTVIYNPIETSFHNKNIKEGESGLVLYVGRVEMYKGLEVLLKAWEKISKEVPHAHLKIVGEGADKKKYEQEVSKNGLGYKVTFTGSIPWNRMQKVYNEAQVVVTPHVWYEPFGRTAAEAMARGKLVVSANAGGPAEILKAGQSGLLFNRKSVDSLAENIKKALALSPLARKQKGQNARTWVKNNLSSEIIAQEYLNFYKEVIK